MATIAGCKAALRAIGVRNKLSCRTTHSPFGGPSKIQVTVLGYDPNAEGPSLTDMREALPNGSFLDVRPVAGVTMATLSEPGANTSFHFLR
jgi:hypothetical protein